MLLVLGLSAYLSGSALEWGWLRFIGLVLLTPIALAVTAILFVAVVLVFQMVVFWVVFYGLPFLSSPSRFWTWRSRPPES